MTVFTKFEVDTTIRCLVIALLLLIRYVTLWPWPLTFDLLTLVSGHTWRVTWSTPPPSLKILRLSVLELWVLTSPIGYHWQERAGHLEARFQGEAVVPLTICWYRSKGNWMRYNFAADSFYIMKSCSAINCFSSGINILAGGRPLPPEILAPSDLPLLKVASFDTFCLVARQPEDIEVQLHLTRTRHWLSKERLIKVLRRP